MPETGTLGFAPTQHQITPERVSFVYNTNDSDSLEVAQYYRDARQVPNANLIGLAITAPTQGATGTTCETALSEADYLSQIETPLKTALESLGADFGTDGISPIWVIILGYGIPIAYDADGETIAIASKLHRLNKGVVNKFSNHTYDRRGEFKFFDSNDATELFITAVLDGPTKEAVMKLIDRSMDVSRQTFITGDVFIDPYGRKVTAADLEYQADILDFINNEVPNLSLDSQVTVDIDDPYQEPTTASFSGDSFYWGWFNPTYSQQLFLSQNERRAFLYNADDRSACNIHYYANSSPFDINGSDFWCNIAINTEPGYASCAGSVDDPGSDALLRPTPFFQALHQGASLGEAFLFASEFVSWKTVLIGDPLMTVNFPVDIPSDQDTSFELIPNNEAILREKEFIEDALGWGARQTRLLNEVRDTVVASEDFSEELNLLFPINRWFNMKNTKSQTDLHFSLVSRWLRYVQLTTNLSANQWLDANSHKVTQRLQAVTQETGAPAIPDSDVYDSGYWEFTFAYTHPDLTLENVFFELEVSKSSTFSSLLVDLSTQTSVLGWEYEGQPFLFVQMPDSGFPSNFSGRRVRFSSPQANFLRSTEVYYIRWTAVNGSGLPFPGATATQRMIIST